MSLNLLQTIIFYERRKVMFANLVPSILKGSKVVQSFVVKNSGPILTTLGVCALSATVVSTYKAAVKAHAEIEKMHEELEDPRTDKSEENLKKIKRAAAIKVAKIMLVPVLFALTCAGCIIGNNYIHMKKQATLAAAYALAEQNLKDYEDSLEPIVGKKKAEQVKEEIAHKDVERRGSSDPNIVWNTGKGDLLFFEPKTGHYIRSSHDSVRLAFEECNNKINNFKNHHEELIARELFEKLGLPREAIDSDIAAAYGYCSGETVGVNLNQTGTSAWGEPFVYMNYHMHLLDADMTI
jgi:ribosomal protein L18E